MRVGLCLGLVVALAAPAVLLGQAKGKRTARKDESRLVIMPPADLKWTDLDPTGSPGVKVADLWGNHTKGPCGASFKLPAGFAARLHTHTNHTKLLIVSATHGQAPKGKPKFRLGAVSSF